MAHPYSADQFDPHIGKTFRAAAGGSDLTLVKVDRSGDLEARERAGLPPGFIVIFAGPPAEVLPEGLHTLSNDEGATFEVYINPIHTVARDRQDYQVVFG